MVGKSLDGISWSECLATFKMDRSPTENGCPRGGLSVLMLQHQQPDCVGTEGSEKTCREINEKEMEGMCLCTSFVPEWSYLALG